MFMTNHLIGFGDGILTPTTVTLITPAATFNSAGGVYTMLLRSTTIPNYRIISSIGLYSASARTIKLKIMKRNSAGNYDVVVDQAQTHPGGGWVDQTLSSTYTIPASGDYCLAASSSAGTDLDVGNVSLDRAYAASDLTGTGVSMTEDTNPTIYPIRYTYLS